MISGTQLFAKQNIAPENKENLKEERNFKIPLIGEIAPEFSAESTNGTINFPSDYGHKWKLLFSHPQDFTPVCSTEILELAYLQDQFEKMGVKLCVVSVDKLETHKDWKAALEKVSLYDRKPIKIKFPLIDDNSVVISKLYGMIHTETNTPKSVRGVFIINPDNIIEAIYFYPMKIGRNTTELVRIISALQLSRADKVMTPANWKPGDNVLIPNHPNVDDTDSTAVARAYYNPAWFLWFKKTNL